MPVNRYTSQECFIEAHLNVTWEISKNGASYINVEGFNIAVMKDNNDKSFWTWRITHINTSNFEWFKGHNKPNSMAAAKKAVLREVAKKLGL